MNNVVELAQRLISMKPCTTDAANEAIREVAEVLKMGGVPCEVLENEGHLMVAARIGHGTRTLVLNGHIDVVPGSERQFQPYIEEGKLYGRGSYDMIGACAVMIMLMCELVRKPPDIQIVLTISSTEETAGAYCTKHMISCGYTGDFAICGEPTNLRISVMSKGVFRVRITVRGKSAHASRPWLGENALLKAVELFHQIEQLPFAHSKNKYFDGASINLSRLSGGTVINQVPESAEIVLDIRFVPGDSPEEMLSQINSLKGDFSVEVIRTGAAVMVSEQNKYLKTLEQITRKYTGADDILMAQHGAADTIFFQEKGIPSVEFGLTGAGHHGSQEFIFMDSLEIYRSILLDLIHKLA